MQGIVKEFVTLPIDEIVPYENNPRNNDEAVADVVESIKQCGELDPIEVDEDNVILSGHTRLKAYIQLGYDSISVLRVTGLTEPQKRKYRLLANKTGEKAQWDFSKLGEELEGLDFDGFDFGFDLSIENIGDDSKDDNNTYTKKTEGLQYEPSENKPDLSELYDENKTAELINKILVSNISQVEKDFLIAAASRHTIFNYAKIADYYAHSSKEMQELMEQSALVIIDFDDAIKNGYTRLSEEIANMYLEDES